MYNSINEARKQQHRRKILVVDDEDINRLMLGNIVARDYDVVYAANGQEALDRIREEKGSLSLVLLDLLMPVMDGFTFLGKIKEDEKTKDLPVIVLTSEGDAEVDSIHMGAMDFISKPYHDPEVILARIERIIELFEGRQLIHKIEYDDTGLLTRDFFLEYMRQMDEIENDSRDLIAVQIENFSFVNEIYGREEGDRVLLLIGKALQDFVTDHPGLACHSNGDEFFIYCRKLDDYDELLQIEEKIARLNDISSARLRFGVLKEEAGVGEAEKRLNNASFACKTLRNDFSKHIAFYDKKLHDDEVLSERLLNDMDRALEKHEFKVYLQPKFDISEESPQVVGAEALVRWQHTAMGMIAPYLFIPLFERNGLIHKLDLYIFRETAAIMAGWKERYGRHIPVSVNISRVDLHDIRLKERLLDILNAYGLKTSDIHLEVTESAYADDDNDIVARIADLQNSGFIIEMDDFGAGFSSLNMLHSMPINVLKLDMKFARTVDKDQKQFHLVKCIVEFSMYLEVATVAEGVENREQYEAMKEAGCDMVQGYYFSKPVTEEEFEKYFK